MRQRAKRGLALLLTLMLTVSLWGNGLAVYAAGTEKATSQAADQPDSAAGTAVGTEADASGADSAPEGQPGAAESGPDSGIPGTGPAEDTSALETESMPESEPEGEAETKPEDPFAADYTLDELLAAARESGAVAAGMLNATEAEAAYHAGLAAVLDLYYGEELYALLDDFSKTIDERATGMLAKYAEARTEREAERPAFVPGEVLVVFKPEVSEAAAEGVMAAQAVTVVEELLPEESEVAVLAEIPVGQTVAEAIEQLDADPLVAFAQPNFLYYAEELTAEATDDPGASSQWYLNYINQAAAWELLDGLTGEREPVTVAVIDTPVDLTHEDLRDNLLLDQARNFVGYGTEAYDGVDGYAYDQPDKSIKDHDDWQYYWLNDPGTHGTHVAGILGAVANNGKGGIGVGSGSTNQVLRIMPLNAFNYGLAAGASTPSYTGATSTSVGLAINYARRNGAKVINLSLGGAYSADNYMEACINVAVNAGVTVVAAAGNAKSGGSALEWNPGSPTNNGRYQPSDYVNTISVINLKRPGTTAYQQDGVNVRYTSSNYGGKDIAAPGDAIYSTYPNNSYNTISGTSMAAPMVSAVVAMLYYARPNITPAEVRHILQVTATDTYQPGYDADTAWGCVNAEYAMYTVLTVPTNLTVQPAGGNTALALAWGAVEDAAHYEVNRISGATGATEVFNNIEATAFTDTSVSTDDVYTYQVRAHFMRDGMDVTGGWGTAAAGALPLAAPTYFAASNNAAGGDIILTWEAIPAASGYKIVRYREDMEDKVFLVDGGGTSTYTDRGTTQIAANGGTVYEYRIYSMRTLSSAPKPLTGGFSEKSDPVSRSAPAPGELSAEPSGPSGVALRWSPVPNTGSYVIQRKVGNGGFENLTVLTGSNIVTSGTTVTYTDHTCTAANLYTYRVISRAQRDETIDSPASEAAIGYTEMAAPALSAQAQSGGAVALAWGVVSGAQQYEVWRSFGGVETLVATVGTTSYTDDDPTLPLGVQVTYWVKALREVGGGLPPQYSKASGNKTVVPAFPATAGAQVVANHPGNLKLSWGAVPGATGYNIYRAVLSPADEKPVYEKSTPPPAPATPTPAFTS